MRRPPPFPCQGPPCRQGVVAREQPGDGRATRRKGPGSLVPVPLCPKLEVSHMGDERPLCPLFELLSSVSGTPSPTPQNLDGSLRPSRPARAGARPLHPSTGLGNVLLPWALSKREIWVSFHLLCKLAFLFSFSAGSRGESSSFELLQVVTLPSCPPSQGVAVEARPVALSRASAQPSVLFPAA